MKLSCPLVPLVKEGQDLRATPVEISYTPVRAELVEAGAQGFDKLSPNGFLFN
jgi:hypothetical protein